MSCLKTFGTLYVYQCIIRTINFYFSLTCVSVFVMLLLSGGIISLGKKWALHLWKCTIHLPDICSVTCSATLWAYAVEDWWRVIGSKGCGGSMCVYYKGHFLALIFSMFYDGKTEGNKYIIIQPLYKTTFNTWAFSPTCLRLHRSLI